MSGPKIGLVLTRLVVPAWVAFGATFKLVEATPKTLPPKTILTLADRGHIDLYVLLASLIGLEFLAVALMVFMARWARLVAAAILSVFCLILIAEMVQGNVTSCGCLGKVTMPPWLMLGIDGTMLLGVLVFDPSPIVPARPSRLALVPAIVAAAIGFWLSFSRIVPAGRAVEPGPQAFVQPPNGNAVPADPTINPAPKALPGYWFASDIDSWPGASWREIELFQFMSRWPSGLDTGTRYVVFYSRTCDHCEEMFRDDLTDPALGSLVTAVEVPQSKTEMTSASAWFMPRTECEMLQLPVGCEWIITTPLTLKIADGVVECAEEGGHEHCMDLK